MKKIFFSINFCLLFSCLFIGCATYKLFPTKKTYALSPSSRSSIPDSISQNLKVEAYKNKISFSGKDQAYAEYTFKSGKRFPIPPPKCGPGKCDLITFEIRPEVLYLILEDSEPVALETKFESAEFKDVMQHAPGNKLTFEAP